MESGLVEVREWKLGWYFRPDEGDGGLHLVPEDLFVDDSSERGYVTWADVSRSHTLSTSVPGEESEEWWRQSGVTKQVACWICGSIALTERKRGNQRDSGRQAYIGLPGWWFNGVCPIKEDIGALSPKEL
jgi:hypothetical protein